MDDLVAFLAARLDEDEAAATAVRVARSADPAFREAAGRWTLREHPSESAMIRDGNGNVVVFDEGAPSDEEAAHIARHDPARALREVEAMREILTAYVKTEAGGYRGDGWIAFRFAVETLAEVWSGHPDYRPEWKP